MATKKEAINLSLNKLYINIPKGVVLSFSSKIKIDKNKLKNPLPKLLIKKAQFYIVHPDLSSTEIAKNPKILKYIFFTLKRKE